MTDKKNILFNYQSVKNKKEKEAVKDKKCEEYPLAPYIIDRWIADGILKLPIVN